MMEDKHFKHLHSWLGNLDLIIYQPIESEGFKSARSSYIESIVTIDKRLKIPNLYFSGYQPDLIKYGSELSKVERYKHLFEKSGTQHYRCVVQCFKRGMSPAQTSTALSNGEYISLEHVYNEAQKSIKVLRCREQQASIDIPVSQFIEENYQKVKLFHIHNHPSNIMLQHFLDNLLSRLGYSFFPKIEGAELLAHEYPPILPSVVQGLNLEFNDKSAFISGINYDLEEWVANCFDLYKETPNIASKF